MKTVIKVVQDTDAESPRTSCDNLGVMVTWHRQYRLGDKQPRISAEEWLADPDNVPEGSIVLPLYLYDHSGISMSTSPFSCPWDSGQVGVIVATPDKIKEAFMVSVITDEVREQATKALVQEVSTYDDYLTGNVWGYTIENFVTCPTCGHTAPDDDGDSCWGFIGSDPSTLAAMKEHVDKKHHEALERAWANRGA